jgi:arsenate reductase-like glutaredoxin family protein
MVETMSNEYIHKDDAYEWLRDKEIVFAEQDFAKVQVERDTYKECVAQFVKAWRQLEGTTQLTSAMELALYLAEKAANND